MSPIKDPKTDIAFIQKRGKTIDYHTLVTLQSQKSKYIKTLDRSTQHLEPFYFWNELHTETESLFCGIVCEIVWHNFDSFYDLEVP